MTRDPYVDLTDPILSNKSVELGVFSNKFSVIQKKELLVLGGYLQTVWRVKGKKPYDIPPIDEIIANTTEMIHDDYFKSKDKLWMHHCASSLRALLADLRFPEDLRCAFSTIPKDSDAEDLYMRIRLILDFFHSMTHFRTNKQIDSANKILERRVNKIDAETFEEICALFIVDLLKIFKTYCMKPGKNSDLYESN